MMISNSIHRESEQERRYSMLMALVVAAVGFFMTVYSLEILAGLMARWFCRLY